MSLLNDPSIISTQFYARLPINQIPLPEILLRTELFFSVPADWHVVITDIKESTTAIFAGLHQQVNLIATGSTVAALNIAFHNRVNIPFFFGGDGATFLVPSALKEELLKALYLYRLNVLKNTNLELRVGEVSVQQIYDQGHELRISKFSRSASCAVPILLGDGLEYAEKIIKGTAKHLPHTIDEKIDPDLTGMLCRWDEIPAPEASKEVVTLLVTNRSAGAQAVVFSKVMRLIDDIYGPPAHRQPITVAKLRLRSTFTKLSNEISKSAGRFDIFGSLRNWYINVLGYIYFRSPTGIAYLKNLVEMSDTLLIDGRINTVICGSVTQRTMLKNGLEAMEASGDICYGVHISSASVMSCYVRDPQDGHIYFVDGSQGGYTMAAKTLKAKIKNTQL